MIRFRHHTSLPEFEALHERAGKQGKTVRVDRQALLHLLMDHSALSGRIEELENSTPTKGAKS